jgi:hypothetical protein
MVMNKYDAIEVSDTAANVMKEKFIEIQADGKRIMVNPDFIISFEPEILHSV